MPTARTEVAGAALGGRIYVLGGFNGERDVEGYDPRADRWTRAAPFPVSVHHAAAVATAERLVVFGGYRDRWQPTAEAYISDPGVNAWAALPAMPTPRGSPAAALLDGRIHVVGGVTPDRRNTDAHEIFDLSTQTWSSGTRIPTARDHFVLIAVEDRLVAIGGRIDGDPARNLGTVEVLRTGAADWSRGSSMPTPRSGLAAAVLGGSIVVLGGESPTQTFAQVEAYDPARDTWSTLPPLPTARHGLAAAAVDGRNLRHRGRPPTGRDALGRQRGLRALKHRRRAPASRRCTAPRATPAVGFRRIDQGQFVALLGAGEQKPRVVGRAVLHGQGQSCGKTQCEPAASAVDDSHRSRSHFASSPRCLTDPCPACWGQACPRIPGSCRHRRRERCPFRPTPAGGRERRATTPCASRPRTARRPARFSLSPPRPCRT